MQIPSARTLIFIAEQIARHRNVERLEMTPRVGGAISASGIKTSH
jgi:ribosomal protein L31E